MSNKLPR